MYTTSIQKLFCSREKALAIFVFHHVGVLGKSRNPANVSTTFKLLSHSSKPHLARSNANTRNEMIATPTHACEIVNLHSWRCSLTIIRSHMWSMNLPFLLTFLLKSISHQISHKMDDHIWLSYHNSTPRRTKVLWMFRCAYVIIPVNILSIEES